MKPLALVATFGIVALSTASAQAKGGGRVTLEGAYARLSKVLALKAGQFSSKEESTAAQLCDRNDLSEVTAAFKNVLRARDQEKDTRTLMILDQHIEAQ